MEVVSFTEAQAYLEYAQPWLEQREATHHLALGLALHYARHALPGQWWVIEAAQQPILATGFMGGYLSATFEQIDPAAVELLVSALHTATITPIRIIAPQPLAATLADTWARYSEQQWTLYMPQRFYTLHRIIWPDPMPSGILRAATSADLELVVDWAECFQIDIGEATERSSLRIQTEKRLQNEALWLWCVADQPVAMAGLARPTRHGIAINSVYTPPTLRGQGYASAAVAQLSALQLQQGYQFCCLFTDLANPTSNSIYQRIGYQPVGDWEVYHPQPHPAQASR